MAIKPLNLVLFFLLICVIAMLEVQVGGIYGIAGRRPQTDLLVTQNATNSMPS